MTALPRNTILLGDALDVLRTIPAESVDTVVTSPPYFLLRNYGHAGQVGLEPTVHDYVEQIVAVCAELRRVLKPSGSLWLNLGDSFSRHHRYGAQAKSLLLAPERILLALSEAGWIIRSKVVWSKPNPMPTSVRDRLSCTWEPVYLLTRQGSYFFDLDAIREPHKSKPRGLTRRPSSQMTNVGPKHRPKYDARPQAHATWAGPLAGRNDGLERLHRAGVPGNPGGKNPGDVWSIPTAAYRGAHFATFPVRLVTRPLRATCPERTCSKCGAPWHQRQGHATAPGCACGATWQPGIVLDPFMGAGTTAVAAQSLGRDYLGIELNPAYRTLALNRIASAVQRAPHLPNEEMPDHQGAPIAA